MADTELDEKIEAVFYTDGSCRPTNPGYAGFGVFGYTYKHTVRPKNTKHPIKAALSFTPAGVSKDKSETPIEVLSILEAAIAIPGNDSTNNIAELKASLYALDWVNKNPQVKRMLIITDSRYFVNNFKDYLKGWADKGFQKLDGTVISNVQIWGAIEKARNDLLAKGVVIDVQWIKGHSEDYGNEMADMLALIGSNATRVQILENKVFNTSIIETCIPYSEFKQSYQNKDIVYYFKDVFFSSTHKDDEELCFLSSTEDDTNVGRRTTDSIFVVNKGFVPKLIRDLRAFYRAIPRPYSCNCSIRLSKLENRDILRLAESVDVTYLLVPISRTSNEYSLVGTTKTFLQENTMEFPFIVNIAKLTNAITNLMQDDQAGISFNLTDQFVSEGKLLIDNKDKFIDLTKTVNDSIEFCQRPLVGIGYDVPAYLTLKKLEESIETVHAVFHKNDDNNFYTLYTKVVLPDRELCSINMIDKYLTLKPI